ncbi:MAG: protein kinase [Victivallales bacterium]
MRFECPFCSFIIKDIAESSLGDKVLCPNCGHQAFIPTDHFAPGRIIGDFLIKEKIGEGSIGAVYFAQQRSLDRNVALKILSRKYTNAKGMASFLAEARAAAKLSHPNLVQALSVGDEAGTLFMAMTYVRGETVKSKIKRDKKIPVDESLHIIQQVAEALHYAWEESKLIHRDVKPENIMLDEDGVAKLTDLGLAMHQADWYQGMEISGSPSYMSPEQFIGDKLDTRSDIYSLGISLYQMLTGKLPFDASTLNSMAKQHFYQKPTPLNKIDAFIPAKVNALVKKMIEKHPDNRFQTMDELLRQIWEVRQTTAPSKDLVPDVHTVSIKRLDYTLQTESKEKKEKLKLDDLQHKKRAGAWLSIMAFAIPVVILIIIIISGVSYSNSKVLHTKMKLVDDFDNVMKTSTAYSIEDLEKKCDEIIAYLGTPREDREKILVLRMQVHKMEVDKMGLVKDSRRYVLASQGSLKEKDKTQKKFDELVQERDDLRNQLARKIEELKDKDSYVSRIGDNASLIKEKNKIKKDYDELKAYADKIAKDYEAYWKDDIRQRVMSMITQARFAEGAEMLKGISQTKPESLTPWFAVKISRLERMDRMYPLLTTSGSKYVGVQVDEGKLIKIVNGEVDIQDLNGTFSLKRWSALSVNSLYSIVKNEFKDVDENTIKTDIAFLAGRPGEAKKLNPSDLEMNSVCNLFYRSTLESIKYLAPNDRKKAVLKAQFLYKEFYSMPGYDNCREDIVAILGKDFIPEDEVKKTTTLPVVPTAP